MQRYFIEKEGLEITGQDVFHITKVMRMKTGDHVIVCHKKLCYEVELDIQDTRVFFNVIKPIDAPIEPNITLIQGLPKHPKTETITKYATLFGASSIIFVPMHRSIAKPDNEANKLKRLFAIAKEASELSHRHDVPTVLFIDQLKTIDWTIYTHIIMADENEKTTHLDYAIPHIQPDDRIAIIIGPEGGISDAERIYFQHIHAIAVSLGHRILPTELASLYPLVYLSLKNV